jgi:hypothetical protein
MNPVGRYRNDDGIRKMLESAQAMGSLNLAKMDEDSRSKVMQAIKTVGEETINGTIAGWRPHDHKDHALYCEALSELVSRIQQQNVV